jgi:hypothetical protein
LLHFFHSHQVAAQLISCYTFRCMADTSSNANQTTPQSDDMHKGRILLQWEFPEYPKHDRGKTWYVLMIGLGIGLIAYALYTNNFLFAVIILLAALILFTHHRTEPTPVMFTVYDTGVQVGDLFYLFRELGSFAIIYEPPHVKRLYLMPKKAVLRTEISIPLQDQNPLHVRSLFLDFVSEDLEREEESHNDTLSRLLKI